MAVVASERYGLQIHDDFSGGNESALGSGLRYFLRSRDVLPVRLLQSPCHLVNVIYKHVVKQLKQQDPAPLRTTMIQIY